VSSPSLQVEFLTVSRRATHFATGALTVFLTTRHLRRRCRRIGVEACLHEGAFLVEKVDLERRLHRAFAEGENDRRLTILDRRKTRQLASGANLTFESRLRLSSFSNAKFIKLH
jgi:hypothetical protein